MERIKAFQQRLTGENRGKLNLIYMNALAELHNYGARLGCDYRAMTPQERTAFVRRVGRSAVLDRAILFLPEGPCASARLTGSAALPHMTALELIDWLLELEETVVQKKLPILLKKDRDSDVFTQLLADLSGLFPNAEFRVSGEDLAQ